MALLAVLQIAVLSLLVLASPAASFDDYVNDLGEDVAFDCPNGEALTEFASSQGEISIRRKRSTGDFDRQFELSCTPIESKAKVFCEEFEMINELEEKLMAFQCPPNAYIGGVRSVFDSSDAGGNGRDRNWGIKCCRILGKCTRDCSLLGPLNLVTAPFSRQADPGHFFTGIYSIYDSDGTSDDRVFYLEQCRAAQCGSRKLLKYIFPWAKSSPSSPPT